MNKITINITHINIIPVELIRPINRKTENAGMENISTNGRDGKCQYGISQHIVITVPNLSKSNNITQNNARH